jgi:hypothetical protein
MVDSGLLEDLKDSGPFCFGKYQYVTQVGMRQINKLYGLTK